MQVTDEVFAYIKSLCKLTFEPEEEKEARAQLDKLAGYVEELERIPTEPVGMEAGQNVLRADSVTPSLPQKQVLGNSAKQAGGCFVAPDTLGQEA